MRAKACFLLFCFMLLLFTPGCSQVNQLNERLIVNGIGVDIEDGAYVVTMHVFDAQRASAGGEESQDIVVVTGRGRSVTPLMPSPSKAERSPCFHKTWF